MVYNERWLNNPSQIKYKDNLGNEKKVGPTEIAAILLEPGVLFISERIQYDSTSTKQGKLPTSPIPSYKEEFAFVKVLVYSEISLLSWIQNDREHLFLKKKSDPAVELINHSFVSKDQVLVNRGYLMQLREFFKDCPSIKINDNLSYSSKSISTLVVSYNQCKNNSVNEYRSHEKTRVEAGIFGAVAFDKFSPSFDGDLGFGFGGKVDFYFPNGNYRTALSSELGYRKTGEQKSTSNNEVYEIQSIQWSVLYRYAPIRKNRTFYMGGGVAYSAGLKDQYYIGSGNNLSDQAYGYISILVDCHFKLTTQPSFNLRFESGDSIVMDGYEFGNMPLNRSASLRLSANWIF